MDDNDKYARITKLITFELVAQYFIKYIRVPATKIFLYKTSMIRFPKYRLVKRAFFGKSSVKNQSNIYIYFTYAQIYFILITVGR